MNIRERLLELKDTKYQSFQAKLIPNISMDSIIGIKIPVLRNIGKEYMKDIESFIFLNDLPHKYLEENLLHVILLSNNKDYYFVINNLDKFLCFADNWAVTDTINPKCFNKHKEELIIKVKEWILRSDTYKIRFGIKVLMSFYLDDDFKVEYLDYPLLTSNTDYYVLMMESWYYATALAKKFKDTIKYLENKKLSIFVHNKTIQKAIESYRITDEQKEYLRTLKIKEK